MEQLLIIRETIIKFYKQYESFILPVLKFFLGIFIFNKIHSIGLINTELFPFAGQAASFAAVMLLGVVFALVPQTLSHLIIILDIAVQFSANVEIAAVIFLALLCILLFYVRLAPRESIWIILTMAAFYLKIPYLIPIVAGLYCSFTVVVPIIVGVFLYNFIPVIQSLAATSPTAGLDVSEMPGTFVDLYTSLSNSFTSTQGWIFYAFVFVMVIIIVHAVSRLAVDFAKEIAILLGVVLNIFGFIMAVLMAKENIGIGGMIFSSFFCGILAELTRFFDSILDYQRAESVQFEDENNYYYVKVVPKVILTKRKRVVRRIRPQPEEDE